MYIKVYIILFNSQRECTPIINRSTGVVVLYCHGISISYIIYGHISLGAFNALYMSTAHERENVMTTFPPFERNCSYIYA